MALMVPGRADRRFTLAETARRIGDALASEGDASAWVAVRDFVDGFFSAARMTRSELISEAPATVEPHFDAYLGALAEHLSVHHELAAPAWTQAPERFLEQWWFPTRFKSLHAMALVQSPASFRRRGIFVDATELERV